MLVRKTLERKNVDGHVMTMQFTSHANIHEFYYSDYNVTAIINE